MIRYLAFLRGVSPTNLTMSELKRCFESAGFSDVKTLLSSGNVVFAAKDKTVSALERQVEKALAQGVGREFYTIVRSVSALQAIIDADPYRKYSLPEGAKRVVTFLREERKPMIAVPAELDGARILEIKGREVFSAYVASPRGPVFMSLIEKALGSEVTTRTWETVKKCANA